MSTLHDVIESPATPSTSPAPYAGGALFEAVVQTLLRPVLRPAVPRGGAARDRRGAARPYVREHRLTAGVYVPTRFLIDAGFQKQEITVEEITLA